VLLFTFHRMFQRQTHVDLQKVMRCNVFRDKEFYIPGGVVRDGIRQTDVPGPHDTQARREKRKILRKY
jgi:hypothetical protein